MGVFEQFPYTNFHDLNLDWLLKLMKKLDKKVDDFVLTSTVKYADPFDWNIGTQYPANTVVGDPSTGTAYIAVKPVPVNIPITDTEYWTPVFNLQALWDALTNIMESVVPINQKSDTTANQQIENQELFWLNHKLYIATAQIPLNGDIVIGSNCRAVTIEEMLLQAQSYLTNRLNTTDNNVDTLTTRLNDAYTIINDGRNIVYAGGNSKYKTITAAVEYAKTICSLDNRVTIWIYPGTYHEQITLTPNPGIDFFGYGVTIISDQPYPSSPLYFSGSMTCVGIYFYGNGKEDAEGRGSYGVHYEDVGNPPANAQIFFYNCIIGSSNFDGIGIGITRGCLMRFYYCEFQNTGGYLTNRAAFYAHNNFNDGWDGAIILNHCWFNSTDIDFFVRDVQKNSKLGISVYNCAGTTNRCRFWLTEQNNDTNLERYLTSSEHITINGNNNSEIVLNTPFTPTMRASIVTNVVSVYVPAPWDGNDIETCAVTESTSGVSYQYVGGVSNNSLGFLINNFQTGQTITDQIAITATPL